MREEKIVPPSAGEKTRLGDGGPAFAAIAYEGIGGAYTEQSGMTLRDYFAAKAMQGLVADAWLKCESLTLEKLCSDAWLFADAMLQARSAHPSSEGSL